MDKAYFRIVLLGTCLAFFVVLLGAFTRLSDAGLGCPDWPGCYGQLKVPESQSAIKEASQNYPSVPLEQKKAWAEMVHRYFAGSLGLLILVIALWTFIASKRQGLKRLILPLYLVGLVIFQAALGMWTVTWKLLPLIVMGHLLGGFLLLASLWSIYLRKNSAPLKNTPLFFIAVLGLIIIAFQVFLGGWTSANYAAIICPDFPFCHGQLFPPMDIQQGFNFFSPIGVNYQGGALAAPARVAIQMFHRYGGAVTGLYLGSLAWYLMFFKNASPFRRLGWVIFSLVVLQICLGIINVLGQLPLEIAVAHNGSAALLILSMITLVSKLSPRN